MKKLKFEEIASKKKGGKKQINLLTGKAVKTRKKSKEPKPFKLKKGETIIGDADTNLFVTISKNYKGISNNLAGVINNLPQDLQNFINNGTVTSIKTTAVQAMYIIDKKFQFIIEPTKLGRHHKLHVTVKDNKKVYLKKYI